MDRSIKLAVEMELGHIAELYGEEGLTFAMKLLKKRLSGHETRNHSMEEICSGCIHGDWHSCCDTFCYCQVASDDFNEDNVDRIDGTCKKKEK